MQTGENGIGRIIHRTAQVTKEGEDPRQVGCIPFDIVQKYINFWASASHDLFGGEDSTNAAEYFAAGLKGRYREGDGIYKDPKALEQNYKLEVPEEGRLVEHEIPLRRAMNALLLDAYMADTARIAARWNRDLKSLGVEHQITLPHRRFNRHQGIYSGLWFTPAGEPISHDEWERRKGEWLPAQADRDYVRSLMKPVYAIGKIANWIAPPPTGVNNQPFEFEYVKLH